MKRGNLYQTPAYLTREQRDGLARLSKATRIPMQAYIREGVELVLAKYRKKGGTK